jgi:hypothetical protein
MKTYLGSGDIDRGEWLASRPGRFTPTERAPGTLWLGGWMGPRASLDAVVNRKMQSMKTEICFNKCEYGDLQYAKILCISPLKFMFCRLRTIAALGSR